MYFQPHKAENKLTVMYRIPKILILPLAFEKMSQIVKQSDEEVGWLGAVERDLNGDFYIEDVFLFEQEVNSATCEITPEGLAKVADELLGREDGMELVNSIRLWGHSHVNMGCFASAQDETQMHVFEEGKPEFFIRLIANKNGEMKFTLMDYERQLRVDDVSWEVYHTMPTGIDKSIEEELKTKVRKKSGVVVYGGGASDSYKGYNSKYYGEDEDEYYDGYGYKQYNIYDKRESSQKKDVELEKERAKQKDHEERMDDWLLNTFAPWELCELATCKEIDEVWDTLNLYMPNGCDRTTAQEVWEYCKTNYDRLVQMQLDEELTEEEEKELEADETARQIDEATKRFMEDRYGNKVPVSDKDGMIYDKNGNKIKVFRGGSK